jgi:putative nucleotidyltransferase with HDIG domain
MKAGKENIELKNDTSTVVLKSNDKIKIPVVIAILPFLSMLTAILPGVLNRSPGVEIARIGIITLLLTGVVTLYIRLYADSILNKKLVKTIIILGYLASICLLLFIPKPETFSFWMIGGLLVSMLIDNKLGLLLHFNLSFVMGITLTLRPELVIQVLIMGVLLSMLSNALKQKTTVIYAAIIILSSNITLAFAINNFIFESKVNNNYMNSLFSILAVIVTAFFVCTLYENVGNKKDSFQTLPENGYALKPEQETEVSAFIDNTELNTMVTSQELITKEENIDLGAPISQGARTSYEVLCDLDNDLIKRMRQHSEILYSHSVLIGDLSYRAAIEISANEMLALAGGLYHEVGKLSGKNYIEEGLIIAEDYAFPNELKAILKEHNIKYEKPGSVEAAIVMLADSVVATIEYIEKTDEHKYTTNKIIDNIFQMRMDKGTFDSCSLSLKDYKKLKEFFQKEYNK